MIKKIVFFISLFGITLTLGISLLQERLINKTYKLFYSQNQELEGFSYCYETISISQYQFSQEEIIFTVLNNMLSGPQNIFLTSQFKKPISIRKVYLFGDTLVIDFNRYLLELDPEEENLLLTVSVNTFKVNFPEIKQIIWLTEGRQVRFIKGAYRYTNPILIKNFTLFNKTFSNLNSDYSPPC